MQPSERILALFEHISSIPRETKNEAALRAWLQAWAAGRQLHTQTDTVGNLVIYVPASVGCEHKPTLILQGHLDMVCEKLPASDHDFTRDPIRLLRRGDWLHADQTTLGADNGVAIALAMALVEEVSLPHPALELLFTVEEEGGIVGADQLDPTLLSGKTLINLDSETEGEFTIGSAGGGSVFITLPVQPNALNEQHSAFTLKVEGLQGGHSGDDIHRHRGNANKILARVLEHIQREIPIRLAAFQGGSARNAIPRDAQAVFTCPPEAATACKNLLQNLQDVLQAEYASSEPRLSLSLIKHTQPLTAALSPTDTRTCLYLLLALPNGVAAMSAEIPGFVETSNNLGVVNLTARGFEIISNQRSARSTRLEELTRRVEIVAQLAGAHTQLSKFFPPWQPDNASPLLQKCRQVYQAQFQREPVVNLIHAGLECGVISDRCDGLDAISFGPTIENPHSPNERLYVPSLERVWQFMVGLFAAY